MRFTVIRTPAPKRVIQPASRTAAPASAPTWAGQCCCTRGGANRANSVGEHNKTFSKASDRQHGSRKTTDAKPQAFRLSRVTCCCLDLKASARIVASKSAKGERTVRRVRLDEIRSGSSTLRNAGASLHKPTKYTFRAETQRRHGAAKAAWSSSDLPAWLNKEKYVREIQPKLKRLTLSVLASSLAVSIPYAVEIRSGRVPHEALADTRRARWVSPGSVT